MTDKLSDNPTPQEAADFFSETDAHKIARLQSHIKTLEEALSQSREKVTTLEQQVEGLEGLKRLAHLVKVEWTEYESIGSEGLVRVTYPADVHRELQAIAEKEAGK